MKIILFSPQIPQNTGNIARTCAATNTGLVLVRPLGFSVSDRQMKRAGLDYWDQVNVEVIDDLPSYLANQDAPSFFFSSKAEKSYAQAHFPLQANLIFGSETEGLPKVLWDLYPKNFYTIPMAPGPRCLNLASSAAVVLYEALRQTNFSFSPQ